MICQTIKIFYSPSYDQLGGLIFIDELKVIVNFTLVFGSCRSRALDYTLRSHFTSSNSTQIWANVETNSGSYRSTNMRAP